MQADLEEVGISGLQWIPGAVGMVRFDDEPSVVPDAFIDMLKQRIAQIERAGGLHLDSLKAGDSIEITSGPFAGHEALFDMRFSGEQRVQLLLHWLGRTMKFKINANAVEKRRTR